jgi:DNA-binding beta-propeller fold protein YncE
LGLACAGLALAGCAKHWSPRTTPPAILQQWPYAPAPAKLTLARSLTGFAPGKTTGAALRAIAYGRGQDASGFALPVAVAVGSDGRIAVADAGRRCTHLYLPQTQRYLALTGSKQERMVSPVGVAFDDEAKLYVSDSTGRVFVYGPEGAPLFTLHKAGSETLQRPTGLAWSPRKKWLYVVDTGASRIHAFTAQGTHVLSFGGRGDEEGRFNFPTHIFRSPGGQLYVTDALNFRVVVLDEDGKLLGSFGHHGDGSGDLARPRGLAVDDDGVVYVVDALFDNVQLFNREGEFLLTLGRRGAEQGEFWLPSGVFIGGGELYVCDTYNRRVQVFRITERYQDAGAD